MAEITHDNILLIVNDLKVLEIISSKHFCEWTTTQIFHNHESVAITTRR